MTQIEQDTFEMQVRAANIGNNLYNSFINLKSYWIVFFFLTSGIEG